MGKIGGHFYQDPLRTCIENMLAKAGLIDIPADERADTVTALMIEAQRRIGLAMLESLDKPSRQYFRRLMENEGTEEEISAFFAIRIPDHKKKVEEVLDAFCAECLTSVKALGRIRL